MTNIDELSDIERRLLEIAATHVNLTPDDALVELQAETWRATVVGPGAGRRWYECLPDGIADMWPELSIESRITAFATAAAGSSMLGDPFDASFR